MNEDLGRLTEPFDLLEGDETGGEGCEGLVDVASALVADGQTDGAVEPRMGALHDLAVAAGPLATLDAA